MKYKQITISTSHEFSELVALTLTDAGSEGVTIIDDEEMRQVLKASYWDYIDDSVFSQNSIQVLVSGFFDESFDSNIIDLALAQMKENTEFETGSLELTAKIIDSKDWEDVWKQYYKPMKVKNVSIVPKWEKHIYTDTIPIYINPGMAFGTGSHETTYMCIELMQEIDVKDKIIADIGCGSGILGICSLKLGAKKCTFIDTDYNAVCATNENCEYNNVLDKAEIKEGSFFEKDSSIYDIALSNLTADLLIMLYKSLDNHLKTGSKMVLSGIIKERKEEVLSTYLNKFNIIKEQSKGEWIALLIEKK